MSSNAEVSGVAATACSLTDPRGRALHADRPLPEKFLDFEVWRRGERVSSIRQCGPGFRHPPPRKPGLQQRKANRGSAPRAGPRRVRCSYDHRAMSVTVEHRGPVALVEMHRPPHNYFDVGTLAELADAFESLRSPSDCRVAILCSEGKSFCAGADLGDRRTVLDATSQLYAIAARLADAPVSTVAAVQGAAVGGGLGLSLVADFRVASARTRFACNFARLGLHHGFGMTVTLPAVIGNQRALELLLTGRDVRGEEALAIGLVDRLAAGDDVR